MAAGSHEYYGLQLLVGCGRTRLGGCRHGMAAGFAFLIWVASFRWLPGTHTVHGLQAQAGCRVRTFMLECSYAVAVGIAQFSWVVWGYWLPFRRCLVGCTVSVAAGIALFYWGAYFGWLFASAPWVAAKERLADRRGVDVCQAVGNASDSWVTCALWLRSHY